MRAYHVALISIAFAALVAGSPVSTGNKRLIKTSEEDPGQWMTDTEIWGLIEKHQNFIDITDHPGLPIPKTQQQIESIKAIPTTLKFKTAVKSALSKIQRTRVEAFVQSFSTFHTRYYTSQTGVDSQKWLLSEVQASLKGYSGVSSVREVDHSFPQKSVVARIEGSDPNLKSEVIILGAHQDSVNLRGSTLRSPGADDNASGSATVLETLRVIVDGGIIPRRTIEFHWYAAEEVGLRGSAAIASSYRSSNVNVVGMVNFDVDGYQAPGINDIGVYTDNVDAGLTQFIRVLVDEYLDYGRRDTTCGYGCSDHASFRNNGFASAFPAEFKFHPQMHSEQDSFANVGFTQVIEFIKLAVGFTIEFAEPSN